MAAELGGRPLLDNVLDAELFVDRDETLDRGLRGVRAGVNVLLLGPRGSGKTSTLYRLAHLLRGGGAEAVILDGRAAVDATDLLRQLRRRLGGEPDGDLLAELALLGRAAQEDGERVIALLGSIGTRLGAIGAKVTVLVDEAPPAGGAHRLFGRLRDELWRLPATWVATADACDQAAYRKPPADAFFGRVLELRPLPEAAAAALLAKRAPELARPDRDLLARSGRGSPRRLIELARAVVVDGRPAQEVAAAAEREENICGRLGESAHRLYAELVASGAASISDPRLLGRLGWSRPRAQQVVAELEAAGLVESAPEPAPRGRPRKLYRVR